MTKHLPDDLVEVARFRTSIEAAMAQNRLAEEGISARLDGEAMADFGSIFGSAIGGVRLLVNRENQSLAAELLAAGIDADRLDDADYGDETPLVEDKVTESDPRLTRALRAALIGSLLLPPFLNIYSLYIIFRHRLFRSPWKWQAFLALGINLLVFVVVIVFWIQVLHVDEMPTIYDEQGQPIQTKPGLPRTRY